MPPGLLTTTWSLVNGPASVTFTAPNALSTSATFQVPGTYTIRLTAFDGQATSSDDLTVVVAAPGGSGTGLLAQYFNDAGSGVYFTALVLTRTDPVVDFDWASAAPDPTVQADNFSVRWSGQIKAPVTGTYTFTTASDDGVRLYVNGQLLIDNWTDHAVAQNTATIALVADQKYDIRMEFYDHGQLATARLSWAYPGQTLQVVPQWVLYPAPPVNQPPTVDAGPDRTITLPAGAALNGIARDDGLPGSGLTITWSKISGREDSAGGTVTFTNPNAAVTTATFGADGIYVLRLTVSDGAVTVSDDVTVTVNPAPSNRAPVVNAGADMSVTLPSSAALKGTATDDGLPSPPAHVSSTLDESQRSRKRDVLESERAEHVGDVLGRRQLRAATHRVRQRPLGARRRDGDGECGSGERADRAVLQGSGKWDALRDARPHESRSDGELHMGHGIAGCRRDRGQLLCPVDRTRPGTCDRHVSLHDGFRRWHSFVDQWRARDQQLDGPLVDNGYEQRDLAHCRRQVHGHARVLRTRRPGDGQIAVVVSRTVVAGDSTIAPVPVNGGRSRP